MKLRPLTIGVAAIVAFAAGLVLARILVRAPTAPLSLSHATAYPEERALPPLALTGLDGHPLDPGYFAGHWTLVFFGFTQCPDVCPTTLATLARTVQSLGDLPAGERPRVLMISVDPERDTPEVLARYLRFFDRGFDGATGDARAVAAAAAAFGVPYARVAFESGGYTVDHGAGVFIVGPGGGIRAYSSAPHDAQVLAADYRTLVDSDGKWQ